MHYALLAYRGHADSAGRLHLISQTWWLTLRRPREPQENRWWFRFSAEIHQHNVTFRSITRTFVSVCMVRSQKDRALLERGASVAFSVSFSALKNATAM
jgi:hypothetical protein